MRPKVSICGAGAVGLYLAVMAGKTLREGVSLHSLSTRGTTRRLIVESAYGKCTNQVVAIKKCQNLSEVIFLVCDLGRIEQYLSAIRNDRFGLPTYIYFMQNGLLASRYDNEAGNSRFRRISIGGVSLTAEGDILRCKGRARPLFEISRAARIEMSANGGIAIKTLAAVGNLKIRSNETVVVWNKLVRSGPHFIDTLLSLQLGKEIGIEERLHIARLLFQEYWDVAALACGEKLPEKSQALVLVEALVADNVINSGTRRYILEGSSEEYEAVVGRVRRYAIQRDLNIATLLMVEYITRKR